MKVVNADLRTTHSVLSAYSQFYVNLFNTCIYSRELAEVFMNVSHFQACVVKRKFKKAELLIKQAMFLAK